MAIALKLQRKSERLMPLSGVFVVFVNKPNTGVLSINLTQGFAGVPKNPAKNPCYNIIFSTILPFSH